ncbi:hypothetical protein OROGR_024686 [Orobanche gracilis]
MNSHIYHAPRYMKLYERCDAYEINTRRYSDDIYHASSIIICHFYIYRIIDHSPPEKRPRVPSAYNRFIKEEIQRIKASNPKISHREAFSTAAKNWAHFPHIHFGPKLDGNKEAKVDHSVAGKGIHKSPDF